jgi:translation initiation factor IF-2
MAKVRIFEWAKENNQRSNEVVKKLQAEGYKIRNHTDLVDDGILKELVKVKKEVPKPTQVKEVVNEEKKERKKPEVVSTSTEQPRRENNYKGQNPHPKSNYNNTTNPNYKPNSKPVNKPRGKVPAGGYPPPPRPDQRPGYKPNQGYQGKNPRPAGSATGGYRGNNNNTGQTNTTGGYNRGPRPPFNRNRPEPKTEELDPTTTKPVNAKKIPNNKKKKQTYDRFAQFDTKESNVRIDQKTRTQMKKDAAKEREAALAGQITIVKWSDDMTVGKFSNLLDIPAIDVISKLFELGIMTTINQLIDKESAEILCTDYNVEIVEDDSNQEFEFENLIPEFKEESMQKRAPIVTIMGHVDHGKTTLLDTIRNANVANKESGGITQHIGAYQVKHGNNYITFLDTPGHAAFSAMRSRGADITDITVIVVAADDGVMPQTKESVAHAKEAGTPIIVAVNKIDKEGAQPDRVMGELAELGITAEEWGGDVPFVNISAKQGTNIDALLEYIDVIAEMHEYKAPIDVPAYGTVIEAHLDKGKGSVATVLVEGGTMNLSDPIVIGHTYGSVRVMQDEYAKRHKKVGPSMPVQITGLKDVPFAGDKFVIMSDLKEAQMIGEKRTAMKSQKDRGGAHAMSLDELNAKIAEGEIKELPVIIKADVQGAVEALAASLESIDVNGVKVRVIYKAVGAITETDVMLASTSGAIMIGFNVRPDANSRQLIESEKIDIMLNNIIYKIIEEIEDSMKGMREKKYREDINGYARIDEVFKITGVGKIAGCIVTKGKILRSGKVRLVRDNIVIYDGELGQLKRFKDDVKEVVEGMDCGISIKGFEDLKKGDEFESYTLEEVEE